MQPQPDNKSHLPLPLTSHLKAHAKAYTDLFLEYEKIHDKAKAGENISADDFNLPHDLFNATIKNAEDLLLEKVEAAVHTRLNAELRSANPPADSQRRGQEIASAINRDYWRALKTAIHDWQDSHPETMRAIADTKPLENAFRRQYIDPLPPREPMIIPEGTSDATEVFRRAMQESNGVGIGDFHNRSVGTRFVADCVPVAKQEGCGTLYMEAPDEEFEALNRMGARDLRELATDPENLGSHEFIRMMAAAKANHLRLVNIDIKGPARDVSHLLPPEHRIAMTNFIWKTNIDADQKDLAAQKKDGKFMLFAGQGHLLNQPGRSGLIDEALGLRTMVLTREKKSGAPAFRQGIAPGDPDVYVNGGPHYYDTKKAANAADMEQFAGMLKAVPLPGMKLLSETLRQTADSLKAAAEKTAIDDPKNVSEAPTSPPMSPVAMRATAAPSQKR